jgi:hypothetical protein
VEIIIIGTEPPCPRCRETYERVKRADIDVGTQASIRKIVYSSHEAQRLGRVGTAHEIAEWSDMEVDWNEVRKLATGNWTPELDVFLNPLKDRAVQSGWIMTPVVVIDGSVVHFGNVPETDEIRSWLVTRA